MAKPKPRSRKGAPASSRARSAGRGRVGPLWWGAGLLALGWIAFDANRPAVERQVPQLAALRMPWDAGEPAPPRRETPRHAPAAPRSVAARPAPDRPAPERPAKAERSLERSSGPRTAALRPVPPPAPLKPVVPAAAPRRTEPAAPAAAKTAVPAGPAFDAARPLPAAGSALTTRGPMPLRRAPSAGSPVWMVLEPGRPLRVTRREGGFARVESGIFTGWADIASVPEAAARPAPPPRGNTMPTLAAAEQRRAGPVPTASVPAPSH